MLYLKPGGSNDYKWNLLIVIVSLFILKGATFHVDYSGFKGALTKWQNYPETLDTPSVVNDADLDDLYARQILSSFVKRYSQDEINRRADYEDARDHNNAIGKIPQSDFPTPEKKDDSRCCQGVGESCSMRERRYCRYFQCMVLREVQGAAVEQPSGQWVEGCGVSKYPDAGAIPNASDFVMGGVASRQGEFPWLVMFARRGQSHSCGAFLITEQWVVTAAHCLNNPTDNDPDNYELWVNKHSWSNPNDGIQLYPTFLIPHPEYNSQSMEADIAMFKLPEPLTLTEDIRPVCMPDVNNQYVGVDAIVAGWGSLCDGCGYPDTYEHVDLPIISNADCQLMLIANGRNSEIFDGNICHETPFRDTGGGDSGGAFVHKGADGIFRAIGIVSWGYTPSGDPALPGVGARVSTYVPWINSVMQNN
ncbi:unnamed protein product [Owenia fusiformis]|uniref:Peptidase S1 domain-containing protein n=1 Tax=Owenia fusiformis TaxID=6347 RepID=A0A8S4Q2Z2_OWEFU|nr:unnamed protein product [Owenia fusiformis]